MIKYLFMLISLTVIYSCSDKDKPKEIEELVIFGDSGFCIEDKQGNSYSSTYWIDCDTCNSLNLKYDSTKLDIRQYFEYKKGSSIKASIRRHESTTIILPKYWTTV